LPHVLVTAIATPAATKPNSITSPMIITSLRIFSFSFREALAISLLL